MSKVNISYARFILKSFADLGKDQLGEILMEMFNEKYQKMEAIDLNEVATLEVAVNNGSFQYTLDSNSKLKVTKTVIPLYETTYFLIPVTNSDIQYPSVLSGTINKSSDEGNVFEVKDLDELTLKVEEKFRVKRDQIGKPISAKSLLDKVVADTLGLFYVAKVNYTKI